MKRTYCFFDKEFGQHPDSINGDKDNSVQPVAIQTTLLTQDTVINHVIEALENDNKSYVLGYN